MGKNPPTRLPQNTAVICRLSLKPINSTLLAPTSFMVVELSMAVMKEIGSKWLVDAADY